MGKKYTKITIPVSKLTLDLLKSYYKSERFLVQTHDIYYRHLQTKTQFAIGTITLDAAASFLVTNTLLKKINKNELDKIGYYLHRATQSDMCHWLLAYLENGGNINEAIELFYYKNCIDESNYPFENALKLFQRFRVNLAKSKKLAKNQQITYREPSFYVLENLTAFLPSDEIVFMIISERFKVNIEDITSTKTTSSITKARNAAAYIYRQHGLSFRAIAKKINKSHITAMTAVKKAELDIKLENVAGLRTKAVLDSLLRIPA